MIRFCWALIGFDLNPMKHPLTTSLALAVLASVALVTPAMAVVNMDYVPIGNSGNSADASTGYGAVGYAYNIGKYEVTNAQYVDFLNAKGASNSAGIYNWIMGSYSNIAQSGSSGSYSYGVSSTYANMPVVGVSWFDAARFCNWLQNSQGSGSMETGAYTLSGATSGIILANADAQIHLPTEDEWYKAAYYNGATSTYSLYPNGQDTITLADANYWPDDAVSLDNAGVVDVGYGKASSYGTYGQGGNAWELNDAIISGSSRGMRGGDWGNFDVYMASTISGNAGPSDEYNGVGFRVASVPEPTSCILTILASGMLLMRRKL